MRSAAAQAANTQLWISSFVKRFKPKSRARDARPYEIRTQRLARRGRRALRYHAAIHLLVLYETCVYISPGRAVRAPTGCPISVRRAPSFPESRAFARRPKRCMKKARHPAHSAERRAFLLELLTGFEPVTSSLPRMHSTY